jgi:large subunit ribosomal protein L10
MASPDKVAAVAELVEEFRESNGAVLTEYRGLTVKQLQELRRSLAGNANYAVAKNTLTKLAAKEADVELPDELLVGPTAIAFITGDVVEAAKGLRDFAKANAQLVIKGGFLDGKVLQPDEIKKLADLESREVLLAKLAGGMKASIAGAAGLFNAPLSQAARLFAALQAKTPAEAPVEAAPAAEAADAPVEAEVVEETSTDDAAVEAAPVDEAPAPVDAVDSSDADDSPVSEDTTEDAGSEG